MVSFKSRRDLMSLRCDCGYRNRSANLSRPQQNPRSPNGEQEVMRLLAQGHRDRDIAEQLYISERTVKFHAKNMLEKLGVRTRIQAVFEATQKGWLH